jgi:hypothetical protein
LLNRTQWQRLPLHGSACNGPATGVPIEQPLRRLSLDHRIRHLVGMVFIRVSRLADSALELDPATLLNDVCSFVRCRVQARRTSERNVLVSCVGLGPDRAARRLGCAADVGLNIADVVSAERALDHVAMRQRTASVR